MTSKGSVGSVLEALAGASRAVFSAAVDVPGGLVAVTLSEAEVDTVGGLGHVGVGGGAGRRSIGVDEVCETLFGPIRNVVVLGGPGAGKSTLAAQVAATMISRRRAGSPVPVLLNVSGWSPEHEPLSALVVSAFEQGLSRPSLSAVRQLVAAGAIVFVVDGLDEVSAEARLSAIEQIRRTVGEACGFLLLCRRETFEPIIAGQRVHMFADALVLQIDRIDPVETARYLRALGSEPIRGRWGAVAEHVVAFPRSPLAVALGLPLNLTYFRKIYGSAAADPVALLDERRFYNREAIERHLSTDVVPASLQTAQRWGVDGGRRWLAFLAASARSHPGEQVFWWRLGETVAWPVRRLISALMVGGLAGVITAAGEAPVRGLMPALRSSSRVLVVIGILVLASYSASRWPRGQIRASWRWQRFGRSLWSGLMAGLAAGAWAGVAAVAAIGLLDSVEEGAALGLVLGVMTFLAVMLDRVTARASGVPVYSVLIGPRLLLRRDRLRAVGFALLSGLLLGPGLTLALLFTVARDTEPVVAVLFAGMLAIAPVLVVIVRSAAHTYAVSRLWLFTRRRLPWRTMTFLEDMQRLGLLRVQGASYVFVDPRVAASLVGDSPAQRDPAVTPAPTGN